jgi:hypothetical protein
MRKIQLAIFSIALLLMTSPFKTWAETPEKSNGVAIDFYYEGRLVHSIDSGQERITISKSGNFLWTITYKVDKENSIMKFSGPIRIIEVTLKYDIDGDGEQETITDTMAVLTKSGNLKFVFHSNGAGKRLPRGWDF